MAAHTKKDPALNVNPTLLKPLFRTDANLHGLAMVIDWSLILGTIFCCIQYFHPITYFLALIVIGSRMHALTILMPRCSPFSLLEK